MGHVVTRVVGRAWRCLGRDWGVLQAEPPHPEGGYGICRHRRLIWGGISWFRSSLVTEVNLSLSCPERAASNQSNQLLILQSRANLTWSLSVNNCHIQFMVGLSGMCVCVCVPPSPRGLVAGGRGGDSPLTVSPRDRDHSRSCPCLECPQLSPSLLNPPHAPPPHPVGLRKLQDCAHLLAAVPRGAPARHGAGPHRQSLREELQHHRLLLRHPHQRPCQPGDPGAR